MDRWPYDEVDQGCLVIWDAPQSLSKISADWERFLLWNKREIVISHSNIFQ